MLITRIQNCFTRKWYANANNHQNLRTSKLLIIAFCYLPLIAFASSLVDQLPESLPTSLPGKSAIAPAPTPSQPNIKTPEYVVFEASDQATFSSETAASVLSAPLKEGSSFKTGDILLELDCRVQNADYNKAKAQLQASNMAYNSAQKLKSFGSISGFELTKAQSDNEMAKAEVDKLKAIVDKCVIKAPFNGSIADLKVHTGETVKPGDPLLKIVNTENLELELQVPSQWLQWLKIGSIFYVHVNETNQQVTANVTKINPEIDSISQTVKIFGALESPNDTLKPGMSGQATFANNPIDKK